MSDFSNFVNSVPYFTRYWMGFTFLLTFIGRIGLINRFYFFLLYEPIFSKLELWRPITALFFYPLSPGTGFHFLINCYFLYNYSTRLEKGHFEGRPADYLFMLLFNWILCVIIGLMTELYFLMDPMVLSILYIWCQLNKDLIVNFWFGSRFKAMYLPWVLLAFNMIVSGGGLMELVGIVVGHAYFFLSFKYPQELGGPQLLTTPQILYSWFPNQRVAVHGFDTSSWQRPNPTASTTTRRHNWGPGHVLGGR